MSTHSLVPASTLKSGDRIIGDSGAVVVITGSVDPGQTMMGCVAVETEVGTIYLDEDDEVTIVRADAYKPAETWLTLIEHEHGIDWSLHPSQDDAYAAVDQYVAEWWDSEKNYGVRATDASYKPVPEDPREARDAYFDGHDTESFMVQVST